MAAHRPVVFSPCYIEPLKAMLPLMEAVRPSREVFVLNTVAPGVDDGEQMAALLQPTGVPFATEFEADPAAITRLPRWLRWPYHVDRGARAVTTGALAEVIDRYAAEARWRRISASWIDRLRPAALVVGGETNPIQKHFIDQCNRRGIPSVTLQWGIANASPRHTREMVERDRRRDDLTRSPLARLRKAVIHRAVHAVLRITGLSIDIPSPIFGGGHATVFAVIGQECFDNYVQMGIPPQKMVVVGYPIYEDAVQHRHRLISDREARATVFRELGLREDRELVLWGTNDQRKYYEGFCSYGELFASWQRKLAILLELSDNYEIVMKVHPKEHLEDYLPLRALSSRVHVVKEYDVRKIIPHCSLFVTRFSSTAVDALCLEKPVVTYNYPRIPGGTLYEDLGGTIHVDSDDAFRAAATGLLIDGALRAEARMRRDAFLARYLDIGGDPAAVRFARLLDTLVSHTDRGVLAVPVPARQQTG